MALWTKFAASGAGNEIGRPVVGGGRRRRSGDDAKYAVSSVALYGSLLSLRQTLPEVP